MLRYSLFNSKLFASDVWLKTFWLVKFQTFCLNFLLVRASDQTAPRRHHRRRRSKVERDNKGSADSQSLGESGALRHVRRHPPTLPFLLLLIVHPPPPALLCSIRAPWLVPRPVAYKSHWLMGSQLPRTWQRTGGREGGILQIKAPAAAGLGPPSSGSPKQRTGEPPASTGLIPPGLCEALPGSVRLCPGLCLQLRLGAGEAAGGGARWEHGRLSSLEHGALQGHHSETEGRIMNQTRGLIPGTQLKV